MKRQQLELADPAVAQFAVECGIVRYRVAIRLECVTLPALELAMKELSQVYGARLTFRRPAQSGHGWVVRGSIGK